MNWGYLIAGAGLSLAFLGLLFKLVLDRKEATIQKLNADIGSLQRQLSEAKDNGPDARAERLLRKIGILDKDIELLSKDHAKNEQTLTEKIEELTKTTDELNNLRAQIERTNQLLDEATYYKEQFGCPWCGAEVTTIAGQDEEYRSYACGYTYGPNDNYPCPYDPDFPKLDEFDFNIRIDKGDGAFISKPKPLTKNARKLTLHFQSGATEQEVREKIERNYNRHARKP